MAKRTVLYMLDPMPCNSPFDINMAIDADFDLVIPMNNIRLDMVGGLTQDTIFSRGPAGVKKTAIFIGGRDIGLAMHMLKAAENAMMPPFQVSVMADPSGGFTTAAAMVAAVEKQLQEKHGCGLNGLKVVVFGGTGPVGIAAGVIAALCGAEATLVGHSSLLDTAEKARLYGEMFATILDAAQASSDEDKAALIEQADVVFCTAKAGVQVLDAAVLAEAKRLKVAADVNAVPPLGIHGVKRTDCGTPLKFATSSPGALGVGALAVGDIKYRLQLELLRSLLQQEEPIFVDFRQAFEVARLMV